MKKSSRGDDGKSGRAGAESGEETLDLPSCPRARRPSERRWDRGDLQLTSITRRAACQGAGTLPLG